MITNYLLAIYCLALCQQPTYNGIELKVSELRMIAPNFRVTKAEEQVINDRTFYIMKSDSGLATFLPNGKLLAFSDNAEIDPADIHRPPLTDEVLLQRSRAILQKLGYKDYALTYSPPRKEVQFKSPDIPPIYKDFYFNYFPKGASFTFEPLSVGFHYECKTGKITMFGRPADYTLKTAAKSIADEAAKRLANKFFASKHEAPVSKSYGFGFLSPNEYFGGPPELTGSSRFLISAYVFANPEDKIYVDATTGKIVGGEHERKSRIGARLPYPKIEAFDGTPATKIEED